MGYTYAPRGRNGVLALGLTPARIAYVLPAGTDADPDDQADTTVVEVAETVVWNTAGFTYSFDGGVTETSWPGGVPLPIHKIFKDDAAFANLQFAGAGNLNWHIYGGAKNTF